MESEFLARITRAQRAFLTRTAVLERMCGPLCEAVLNRPGSGVALAELARSNLLLVPLDRRGQWYRYHHLFRDMLLAELERHDPGLVPSCSGGRPPGACGTACSRRRWSTPSRPGTSARPATW
jgi:LuxR family transcriptional regulator, maltose regulon positive regulatory protein